MQFTLTYLRDHWTGQQGLGWSFWVNLVTLRLAITVGQSWLISDRVAEDPPFEIPVVALGIFFHVLVFLWQVVGVLRASDLHIRGLGSVTNTWGAQLGMLIAVWILLADMWGIWLLTIPWSDSENSADQMALERASRYNFSLTQDGKVVFFVGEIAHGSTKALVAFLAAHPRADTLALISDGGNIYEARGMAELIASAGLNTRAAGTCNSACTIVFIGGVSRRLDSDARLGFHQYRVEANYPVPFADPRTEEERDLQMFRRAGIAEWFLNRMFLDRPETLWFPRREELQRAGVVTSE